MPEFTRHEPGFPCWLDISVATAELRESLIDFYVTVFGWTFDVGGLETGFYSMALLAGKPVLAVGQQDGDTGAYIVYFGTHDIAVAAERATKRGGNMFMGPMQVMTAGSMALVLDSAGSIHGLWQPNEMTGFAVMNEVAAPSWFDQASAKPEVAAEYYSAPVFADRLRSEQSMRILARGEQWFASITEQGDSPSHWTPGVAVTSLAETAKRVRAAGGEVLFENVPVPGSAITVFRDLVAGSIMSIMENRGEPASD